MLPFLRVSPIRTAQNLPLFRTLYDSDATLYISLKIQVCRNVKDLPLYYRYI